MPPYHINGGGQNSAPILSPIPPLPAPLPASFFESDLHPHGEQQCACQAWWGLFMRGHHHTRGAAGRLCLRAPSPAPRLRVSALCAKDSRAGQSLRGKPRTDDGCICPPTTGGCRRPPRSPPLSPFLTPRPLQHDERQDHPPRVLAHHPHRRRRPDRRRGRSVLGERLPATRVAAAHAQQRWLPAPVSTPLTAATTTTPAGVDWYVCHSMTASQISPRRRCSTAALTPAAAATNLPPPQDAGSPFPAVSSHDLGPVIGWDAWLQSG